MCWCWILIKSPCTPWQGKWFSSSCWWDHSSQTCGASPRLHLRLVPRSRWSQWTWNMFGKQSLFCLGQISGTRGTCKICAPNKTPAIVVMLVLPMSLFSAISDYCEITFNQHKIGVNATKHKLIYNINYFLTILIWLKIIKYNLPICLQLFF